jgi:hypothetical protein
VKPVVQITITVAETGGERTHILTNRPYTQDKAGLKKAFLYARDCLNNFGSDAQNLFDMFDEDILFIDRKQETSFGKSDAETRLNTEYNTDGPLKFYPDEHAVDADPASGVVKGTATWEDANKSKEHLKYDFRFNYVGGTWILAFVHSKP